MNTIRVLNSLDPDQARCFVGPNLGPICLQRLSADNKSCHLLVKSDMKYTWMFCSLQSLRLVMCKDNTKVHVCGIK